MIEVSFARHAQTMKNGLNSAILSMLGKNPDKNVVYSLIYSHSPELEALFEKRTGSQIHTPLSKEQIEFMQNQITVNGKHQANLLGRLRSISNPYFVASPSMRAIQTVFIVANAMGIPPAQVDIDDSQEFLEEVSHPDSDSASFFCNSLEKYLKVSRSQINSRPLIVISHGNILGAVHRHLYPATPNDLFYRGF